jgi:hypothetical protein
LRGTSFDAKPGALFDRSAVREYFSSPITHVTRVSSSRRAGRRFAHIRLDADDVTRLHEVAPFAWSQYSFTKGGPLFVYTQTVGAAAEKDVGNVGWTGREIVAFRLHLPSKIEYHNTDSVRRGNILAWEQPFADRQRGVPLTIDARMQTQSILYRTLWLFGATFVAVAMTFGLVIWWVLRRGSKASEAQAHVDSL